MVEFLSLLVGDFGNYSGMITSPFLKREYTKYLILYLFDIISTVPVFEDYTLVNISVLTIFLLFQLLKVKIFQYKKS
jgi:hypothetical protein